MTRKERRIKAAAEGKCGSCSTRYPEPGRKTCETCLRSRDKAGAHVTSAARVEAFNVCCQSHGAHRFDCGEVVGGLVAYRRRAA